jgi:hypothetical protein
MSLSIYAWDIQVPKLLDFSLPERSRRARGDELEGSVHIEIVEICVDILFF